MSYPLTTWLLWNFNTYLLIESCPSSRDQKCTLLWMQLRAILEHMWIGHYLSSSSSLLQSSQSTSKQAAAAATTIDSTLCHGGKNNGIKWFQDEDVHFSCHSQKMRPPKQQKVYVLCYAKESRYKHLAIISTFSCIYKYLVKTIKPILNKNAKAVLKL